MSAAYLTIFPGTTQFTTSAGTADYGYTPMIWIYYVKGLSNSTASVIWAQRYYTADSGYDPSLVNRDEDMSRTTVRNLKNVASSDIYPTLTIKENEVKIIIECSLHYPTNGKNYKFSDGRYCNKIPQKTAFGFYVYPLPFPQTVDNNKSIFFHSVVIFSPRPGLFSETEPQ